MLDFLVSQLVAAADGFPASAFRRYDRVHRLTAEQVRLIRESKDKLIVIAGDFGISAGMASLIRQRKSYRWVR